MSDSLIIVPDSYANKNNLQNELILDNTLYKRAKDLIGLLLDVGAVFINPDTGIIEFNSFVNYKRHHNVFVGRLLGYIAEGIIVRDCHEKSSSNRRWANIARVLRDEPNLFMNIIKKIFYEPFIDNPDGYKAIGTGFAKTSKDYGHLYNPQSDRDICWVEKAHHAIQLLSVKGVKLNKKIHAGLQIKVSTKSDGRYIVKYFCSKPYFNLYPVVYFDLGNDFNIVKEELLDIRKGIKSKKINKNSILNSNIHLDTFSDYDIIDFMLTRGKDIDNDLHEELEWYKYLLKELISGKIDLLNLTDDNVIFSLMTEYLALQNVISNNTKQESILNLRAY